MTLTMLQSTAAAEWRGRLIKRGSGDRNHWATRTAYYQGVVASVESGLRRPTWADIVAQVRPHGSRTTFYELAGRKARHPLMLAYQERSQRNLLLLSFHYQRGNAVEQLVDETLVWSFWPHRQAWLGEAVKRPAGTVDLGGGLNRALLDWARANPELLAAAGGLPPMCAVEDLMLLHGWDLGPAAAADALASTLRAAGACKSPDEDLVRHL